MRRIGLVLLCGFLTSCSATRFVNVHPVAADPSFIATNDERRGDSIVRTLPEEARDLSRSPLPGSEMDEAHGRSTYSVLLVVTSAVVAVYTAVVMLTEITR